MTDPLLQRLRDFSIDQPGTRLTFATRLAKENRWSLHQAERVICEYKRFLYIQNRRSTIATTTSTNITRIRPAPCCKTNPDPRRAPSNCPTIITPAKS
jgi:hypothetical protein